MNQTVLGTEEVHESTKVDNLHDLAVIDHTFFRLGNDGVNPVLCRLDRGAVGGCDIDHTVIVDVDLCAGLFDDLADHLATGTDDFADLVGRYGHDFNARGVFAKLFAALGDGFGHLAQDMHPAVLGLIQRR